MISNPFDWEVLCLDVEKSPILLIRLHSEKLEFKHYNG